ncbi:MAG: flagellar hook-associated protein FlgK, partial [Proteobacteria bacterium]|nr:flagellar hook-associated protein FlgK [Pseudomonadota bacterium]
MPDMLNTAVSGLLSFQRALSTTSHNIANVSTEGYSRQRVEITTQFPSQVGGMNFGNGAAINSVSRVYDQFLTSEVRGTTSTHSKMDLLTELSSHVDNVLADPVGGISPIMHEFFAAVQDVSDDPSSTTARNNMINVGNTLTARFHNIDERFQQLQENTSKDIRNVVDEINSIVESIRQVNLDLDKISTGGVSSQQSSDLLDTRDKLLQELSEKIDITVVNEQENNLSIFIGNGQTVLNGTRAFTLGAVPNTGDPSQDIIAYNGLTQITDISSALKGGGELGALLEFRDTVLIETRNDLGRVAIAMADSFNDQHLSGMDLNGDLGTNFFSFDDPQVLTFSGNTGSATISSSISDISALTRYDYTLQFDGTDWTITSDSGTVSAAVTDISPLDTTITFEGITLTVDGATNLSAAGDRYRIKPTLEGAASINVLVSDPLLIAAAAPIRTESSLNNLGTTAISAGEVTDVTNVNLLNSVTMTFDNPASTFRSTSAVTVNGTSYAIGAAIPFTNGMTVESNGWQATISGIPQANDVLT